MLADEEAPSEHTNLLDPRVAALNGSSRASRRHTENLAEDAVSVISSHVSKEEQALGGTAVGRR